MGVALSSHGNIDNTILRDEIAFHIAGFCDILSIMRLMTVCDAVQRTIRRYITSVYDVNNVYKPFFGSHARCLEFRRVLADTGALVSGYQAVQLLNRSRCADSSLDIYVDCFQSEYLVRCLLLLGYRYVPASKVNMRWSQLCGTAASEYNRKCTTTTDS